MPQVKPIRIHSSSASHEVSLLLHPPSSTPTHLYYFQKYPASNLILTTGEKKAPWKCRDQGEKKAYVILELSEPTLINGIDIGNEHSCFIEVLVARKGDPESEFKELLLTSSFQTPAESRNSENVNRVRCFSKAAFVESVASKPWELIKLVCTQPFNSRVQYGVAFVTIYTDEETAKPVPTSSNEVEFSVLPKKGIFSIREESPDSDSDKNTSSSLFSRWKQTKQSGGTASPVTAAAAIRDARTSIGERKSPLLLTPVASKKRPSTETPVLDRNRNNLLYDDDDDKEGDEKLEKLIEKDKKRAEEQLLTKKDSKTSHKAVDKEKADSSSSSTPAKKFKFSDNKKDDPVVTTTPSRSRNKSPDPPKPVPTQKKPKKPKTYKPFKKLLEGVVLTISGIQNPERGTLRSKALEMGAKYRADWDDTCTHLICAFRNTPKYNQVQGVGKIVRKDWVMKCHENRKHIPWRRYALDNKEADKSESEGEICDEKDKDEEVAIAVVDDSDKQKDDTDGVNSNPTIADVEEKQKEKIEKTKVDDDDDDILMVYDQVEAPVVICDSGSDTEDEIERVRQEERKVKDKSVAKEEKQDIPKEKEEVKKANGGSHASSSGGFLAGKQFYLDEDNGAVKIIKCNSIIEKYGG